MRRVYMGFPRLDEIRTRREAMGMSLKKFAEIVDVKPNFLSMIETRKANPNFNLLEKIFLTLDQEEQHVLKGVKTVGQFAKKIKDVSKSDSLIDTVQLMQKNGFSQLPVFSNTRCVGLITEHSISNYISSS